MTSHYSHKQKLYVKEQHLLEPKLYASSEPLDLVSPRKSTAQTRDPKTHIPTFTFSPSAFIPTRVLSGLVP